MTRSWLTAVLALAVASACSSPTDGPTDKPLSQNPGLNIVAGAGMTDTIQATLANDLVVELRDQTGNPRAGAIIAFQGAFGGGGPRVLVARTGTIQFTTFAADTTDSSGRASVRVQLGFVAASVGVSAFVAGDTALRTTAIYNVLPGAVAKVRSTPEDTTLYRGKTYALQASAEDRLGNARTESFRYSAVTPATVRVDASGRVETLGVGRALIQVSAGSFIDTVFVSVPPEGVISALRLGSGSIRLQILTLNLDGSGESSRVTSEYWSEAGFSWSPGGSTLAFALGLHDTNLFKQTDAGVAPLLTTASTLQSMAFPRYSRDGAWVYFNGRPGHQNCEIWRVRADGTGIERVGPLADDYAVDVSPDPSPDGSRVAYSTNRVNGTMPVIRMLTLSPRSVTPLDVPGVTPRWLPDGNTVAYVTTKPSWGYLDDHRIMNNYGFLSLMNPDGSSQRIIPTGTKQWYPHFDISSDGKYILARSHVGVLELVEISTGSTIPLTYAKELFHPMWKP